MFLKYRIGREEVRYSGYGIGCFNFSFVSCWYGVIWINYLIILIFSIFIGVKEVILFVLEGW